MWMPLMRTNGAVGAILWSILSATISSWLGLCISCLAAHVFVSRVSQRCLLTRQADMSGWHVTLTRRQDMSPFCVFQRVQKTQDSRHADTSPRHVFWEYTTFYRSCNKHNSKHKLVLLTSNLIIILLDLSIRCIFSIKNPIFLGPGDHLKSNVQYAVVNLNFGILYFSHS